MTVGIDGGYVRDWNNKKSNFEIIVGRSAPWEGEAKRFGFVHGHDDKPKRRLFEMLQSQGMQMNQQVTFVSDGADNVSLSFKPKCRRSASAVDIGDRPEHDGSPWTLWPNLYAPSGTRSTGAWIDAPTPSSSLPTLSSPRARSPRHLT